MLASTALCICRTALTDCPAAQRGKIPDVTAVTATNVMQSDPEHCAEKKHLPSFSKRLNSAVPTCVQNSPSLTKDCLREDKSPCGTVIASIYILYSYHLQQTHRNLADAVSFHVSLIQFNCHSYHITSKSSQLKSKFSKYQGSLA